MNVMYIQYAGDFHEAYERLFVKGGKENYYGQKYSVQAVIEQARRGLNVLVLVLKTNGYVAELETNLRSVGLKGDQVNYNVVEKIISEFAADCVILRTPDVKILRYLRKENIPTLPVFADSFGFMGYFRGRINKFFLSRELKNERIKWVANHQLNAALSVRSLGISSAKILAYDWEHPDTPEKWRKNIPLDISTKQINVFYAGMLSKSKGVFDLIAATKHVAESGRSILLSLAGKVLDSSITDLVRDESESNLVNLLGLIDHDEVLARMHAADLVVVPSHHAYPEGLPMTIMESLMVHTPVIASDHPMFLGRVGHRGAVKFFNEKNSRDLARQILSVCSDFEQYKAMSLNAPREWHDICLPLKWANLVDNWIADPRSADFSEHTIEKHLTPRSSQDI